MNPSSIVPTDSSAPLRERPFQFSLQQLLWFMVACAVVLALGIYWGPLGIALCYAVTCIGALVWGGKKRSSNWTFAGFGMLVVGLLGLCLAPAMFHSMTPSRGAQCHLRLRQITIALQNYHDVYGTFPPAYVADASGKPMHSWRVLILPFLEQQALYDAYRFDEPWDGPHNRQLHSRVVRMYCCPACSPNQPRGETNYLAVVGPQTIWPESKGTKLADVADGMSNTLLVVEAHGSGIHWMEPRDLHVVQMPAAISAPQGMGISGPHGRSGAEANVALVDGSTERLNRDTSGETLRGLLTIAGGEKVIVPSRTTP